MNCSLLRCVYISSDSLVQGGIFPGSQGARLPQNFLAHTKLLQQFTLFLPKVNFTVFLYILSNEGILPITHNMQEIFPCHRKNYLGTASNKLSKEKISCHKKESLIKGRHFSSQEEISCPRKKFLVSGRNVTGRNFLALEEISCHLKETSCNRKVFHANV